MRTPTPVSRLLPAMSLAISLAVTLGACSRPAAQADAGAATPEPAASAATPDTGAAPAAGTAAAPALEADLGASTNEPVWQASISGPVLVLRGLEGERRLAIDAGGVSGDTRTVRATDAVGRVELTVVARGCQDSMSGAAFPFSAVLSIDGGAPIAGWARPASVPAPGEPG